MGDRGSSAHYVLEIYLSTSSGDLPSMDDVEQLVSDQMSGLLDDDTGLVCGDVIILDGACNGFVKGYDIHEPDELVLRPMERIHR